MVEMQALPGASVTHARRRAVGSCARGAAGTISEVGAPGGRARDSTSSRSKPLAAERFALADVLGRVLGAIHAAIDVPLCDRSNVDGFTVLRRYLAQAMRIRAPHAQRRSAGVRCRTEAPLLRARPRDRNRRIDAARRRFRGISSKRN